MEESRAGHAEGARWHVAAFEIRHDFAKAKPIPAADLLFEPHAMLDVARDENLHEPVANGASDQPMRFGIWHVEPGRHLDLRQAAYVMKPSGARREARLVFSKESRFRWSVH